MDRLYVNDTKKAANPKSFISSKIYEGLNHTKIFHIFCISVIIRFLMVIAIQTPEIIDELSYKTMAESFFETGLFRSYAAFYGKLYIPNFLYSFVISFSFYFKENFYIVIKLINSILVSGAIFPLYSILKSFNISEARGKICLILILAMPFHLLCSYSMPESLYFLLLITYFYFMNKYIVSKHFNYLLFAAITVIGLFLAKPHAIAIFLAMIATVAGFKIFEQRLDIKRRTLIEGGLAILIIIAAIMAIYKGFPRFGMYGEVLDDESAKQILDLRQWILLIVGHIEVILFFYFIPIVYVCKAFILSIKNNEEHLGKLTYTITITFLAVFSMVMVFSNTIAANEFYSRLHARYYYFFYTLFILIFICSYDKIRFTNKQNLFITAGAWIVGIGFIKFVPKYLNGLNSSDNLDLSVYAFHPQLIIPIGCLFILFCTAFFLLRITGNKKLKFYTIFLMLIFLIGNLGQLAFQITTSDAWHEYKEYGELMKVKIEGQESTVFLIISGSADPLVVNFFNQFNYVGSFTTSEENVTEAMMAKGVTIPQQAEYVVSLVGLVEAKNYDIIEQEGKCVIYQIKQEKFLESLPLAKLNDNAQTPLFNVDVIERSSKDTVRIIGWALDGNENRTAGGVFIKCGTKIYKGTYGIQRPDVDAAFNGKGNLNNSGI